MCKRPFGLVRTKPSLVNSSLSPPGMERSLPPGETGHREIKAAPEEVDGAYLPQEAAAQGAQVAERVADACRGEILITMLADDAAVEAVLFGDSGVWQSLPAGAMHVSMSTISVTLSERLERMHQEAGQIYATAPVFGRPEAAAAAKLFVVAAGPTEAIEKCQPLFDAMGQKTFVIGEKPSDANLVKLSGNFLIAATIESLGEAIALARKSGIDAHRLERSSSRCRRCEW
jgi:3-hydroxyisobutyrate dehydrogenase-like beta-hydroxyacid dehydrogenase